MEEFHKFPVVKLLKKGRNDRRIQNDHLDANRVRFVGNKFRKCALGLRKWKRGTIK